MATILIIDDDADTRLLVSTLLIRVGHRVFEASDGVAGIALAAEHCPDLVLLDFSLPPTSGPEVMRRLRADSGTRSVRVALYTATSMSAALRDFMEIYGIRDAVPKPAEPREFLDAIERALLR